MYSRWNSLIMGISFLTLLWPYNRVQASDLRDSALVTAQWALRNENPQALADSLALYLEVGGNLTPDDPYSALTLMDGLLTLPGGQELAKTIIATQSRGQFGGAPRIDVIVAQGEVQQTDLTLAANEITWIEARLWRGSGGANIDLELMDMQGNIVAADLDKGTGTEGAGALLQVWTEICMDVTLRVTNAGTAEGRVAILIPQSVRPVCENPG